MKRRLGFITILCIWLMLAGGVSAKLYSWIDENGVKRFSNTPPMVETDRIKDLNVRKETIHDEGADHRRRQKEQKEIKALKQQWRKSEAQKLRKEKDILETGPVVMYSTPRCGYCTKARQFFNKNNVPFIEKDITRSKEAKQEYRELKGRGVPLIKIGDRIIRGWGETTVKSALGI